MEDFGRGIRLDPLAKWTPRPDLRERGFSVLPLWVIIHDTCICWVFGGSGLCDAFVNQPLGTVGTDLLSWT